jgi:hypothetical protein
LESVRIGSLDISRFILGSNPISGFSHQSAEMDSRMRHYFTAAHIKQLFAKAESLGITTVIARADHHIMRIFMEYWDEGGKLQWVAQTCPEIGTIERGVQNAINGGAKACYIHGGLMDHLFAQDNLDEVPPAIDMIRAAGLPAGIAGHNPEIFHWAERELNVDFYMCSYYNPASRVDSAEHQAGGREWFLDKDRDIMVGVIAGLSRPAIHYKVMAAGRNDSAEALGFVRNHLRPTDAVCVGIYDEKDPDMLRRSIELFERGGAR